MHLPTSISSEISDYFYAHTLGDPSDYLCVYGSSVYSPDNTTSDVDMFFVTHGSGRVALSSFVDFIQDLHRRHGRRIDAEVPYENKVHYTAAEVESAIQLKGFEVDGPRVSVPPVRKEASFLGSPQIKSRLALNGLTTPHAVVGKEFARYHTSRERAAEAVTLLAVALLDDDEFGIENLHGVLTTSRSGASGEMYLGYKTEYSPVREYLYGVLSGALDRLVKQDVIRSTSQGYYVDRENFDPVGYLRATTPEL